MPNHMFLSGAGQAKLHSSPNTYGAVEQTTPYVLGEYYLLSTATALETGW